MTTATETRNRTTDRRVIRTKRMLRDALSQLIEEKGFERITVCDLTECADINRGTFYTHYRDKVDLLAQSEEEVINDILGIVGGLSEITLEDLFACYSSGEPFPFIVALYDYIRENGAFIKALIGPKGDPAFASRLKEIVAGNFGAQVLNERYRKDPAPLTRYYLSYYTAAQLGVIQRWLDTGMRESSEEMSAIVLSIMFMRPGDAIEMHGTPGNDRGVGKDETDGR